MNDDPDSTATGARTRHVSRALGAQLRHMFDAVAGDPMPDHLIELADRLERAYEARQSAAGVGEPRVLSQL